jgi:hypothetical protein
LILVGSDSQVLEEFEFGIFGTLPELARTAPPNQEQDQDERDDSYQPRGHGMSSIRADFAAIVFAESPAGP